jgi:disulfide bond formation protein DsbB
MRLKFFAHYGRFLKEKTKTRKFFVRYGMYIAWLISCLAVLGSLYVSEILMIEPCELCWYQRVCIFPLIIQLGIACWQGSAFIIPYIFPQTVIGFLIALYQLILQAFPGISMNLCTDKNRHCSEAIHLGLGPFSMPLLSIIAFLLIALLLLPYRKLMKKRWLFKK